MRVAGVRWRSHNDLNLMTFILYRNSSPCIPVILFSTAFSSWILTSAIQSLVAGPSPIPALGRRGSGGLAREGSYGLCEGPCPSPRVGKDLSTRVARE